jgi:hypothetical protein
VDALSRGGSAVSPAGVFGVSYRTGVVCADEMMLHSDPYPDRESWCDTPAFRTRLRREYGARWPLVHQPTDAPRFREFAQWCGTTRTADWHTRFRAEVAVLDMARTSGGLARLSDRVEQARRPPVAPKKVVPG